MSRKSLMTRAREPFHKADYVTCVTESRVPYTNVVRDLFGFIDFVAVGRGRIIGVQMTSVSNIAARCKKIVANANAPRWLESGGEILVLGLAPGDPDRLAVREARLTPGSSVALKANPGKSPEALVELLRLERGR